jgi:hypothetical protein
MFDYFKDFFNDLNLGRPMTINNEKYIVIDQKQWIAGGGIEVTAVSVISAREADKFAFDQFVEMNTKSFVFVKSKK